MKAFGRRIWPAGPEKIETVVGNLGLQRAFRILSPFGQKPVEAGGIDDRAREDMRADLGALLHDDHGEIRALFIGELFEADRGGKPGGSGTDDDDVEIHRSRRLSLTRSPPLDAVNPVSNDCYNWQADLYRHDAGEVRLVKRCRSRFARPAYK
jgi:hypothetical protein